MVETKSEVLFELTKDHLETGLRGIPVGYCPTSSVDPTKGIFYAGHPLTEMVNLSPEHVIYQLYTGKDGSPEEIKAFTLDLQKRAKCRPELLQYIRALPKEGHPMKLFCSAILICGMLEGKNDYREDCLNLIAKVPEIVATVINHHAGWTTQKPSQPNLGYMENFAYMLNAPKTNLKEMVDVMRLFDILHFDHGGGNLSTFVGKAVASGMEDMYGSISAAMCALAGPRHGKANQDSLEFVNSLLKELGDDPSAGDLEKSLRGRLERNELVYGYGHAVLRVEDPRATLLFAEAKKRHPNNPHVKMALLLREVAPNILKENPKISDPFPNVDSISGVLLSAIGFNYPEYFTVLFGLSRVVGIAIQIVYERCEARGGKGTPIVRPKYIFKPREVK